MMIKSRAPNSNLEVVLMTQKRHVKKSLDMMVLRVYRSCWNKRS